MDTAGIQCDCTSDAQHQQCTPLTVSVRSVSSAAGPGEVCESATVALPTSVKPSGPPVRYMGNCAAGTAPSNSKTLMVKLRP